MFIHLLIGWFRLRSLHAFVHTCVREARPFSDFPGQPSGPHGSYVALFSKVIIITCKI